MLFLPFPGSDENAFRYTEMKSASFENRNSIPSWFPEEINLYTTLPALNASDLDAGDMEELLFVNSSKYWESDGCSCQRFKSESSVFPGQPVAWMQLVNILNHKCFSLIIKVGRPQ